MPLVYVVVEVNDVVDAVAVVVDGVDVVPIDDTEVLGSEVVECVIGVLVCITLVAVVNVVWEEEVEPKIKNASGLWNSINPLTLCGLKHRPLNLSDGRHCCDAPRLLSMFFTNVILLISNMYCKCQLFVELKSASLSFYFHK